MERVKLILNLWKRFFQKKKVKVYVTQHALTYGIRIIKAQIVSEGHYLYAMDNSGSFCYLLGKDCYLTLAEAEEKAEVMKRQSVSRILNY